MPASFSCIFRRNLARELGKHPESAMCIALIEHSWRSAWESIDRSPFFKAVSSLGSKSLRSTSQVLCAADFALKNAAHSALSLAANGLFLPFWALGRTSHFLVLSLGRCFIPPPAIAQSPLQLHPWAMTRPPLSDTANALPLVPISDLLKSLGRPQAKPKAAPDFSEQLHKFVPAVIESRVSDEVLELYAPEAWGRIKVLYPPGRLLKAHRFALKPGTRKSRNGVSLEFAADFYDDFRDTVTHFANRWELGPSEPPSGGYHVVDAEAVEIAP